MRMPRRTGKQRNETIIESQPHNQTSPTQCVKSDHDALIGEHIAVISILK